MRLVVGLGNPGERYRRTRHNAGFMVVDALAARAGALRGQERAEAQVASAVLGGEETLLVKPQTFMNRCGSAVERLLLDHDLRPQQLVVVVDDVALELGRLRVRERGSHGGHNGLRSIIETLASEDFPRVRVGIRKGDIPGELADYVLDPFPPEDVLVVQEVVSRAADAVECLVREGAAVAMNRFNGMPQA
jgi:PTH1 family peptidyl-tRNA hydrolase